MDQDAAVITALEAVLGGRVTSLRRLSGGASRVTSSFDLERDGADPRPLILQRRRGGLASSPDVVMEAALLRAAEHAGVPVPAVVAAGAEDGLDPGWMVVERLGGESIPRRILRDEPFERARGLLTGQTAAALARIHTIDPARVPGLAPTDPLADPLPYLDALHENRPALELGVRWLAANRPPSEADAVVHGDYRMGNFLIVDTGLQGVLDWELAHRGDPAEDIGWLCARAWRFGGAGRVGGYGDLEPFLDAYAAAGGRRFDPEVIRWWEAYATVKWAVICVLQASSHLNGLTRSVELAAIGRRVCENEWDLLGLIGAPLPDVPADLPSPVRSRVTAPFGRPTAGELVEAVAEFLETKVMDRAEGAARFDARVARNVLALVGRELELGPVFAEAHRARLDRLGYDSDRELAAAIRAGAFDADLLGLGAELASAALDQLLVANPGYLR